MRTGNKVIALLLMLGLFGRKVILSLSDNPAVNSELLHYLNALDQAA